MSNIQSKYKKGSSSGAYRRPLFGQPPLRNAYGFQVYCDQYRAARAFLKRFPDDVLIAIKDAVTAILKEREVVG